MTDPTQPEDPTEPLDLSAWQPPAPSAGLADAVIARARLPEAVARTAGAGGAGRSGAALAIAALVISVLAIAGVVVTQLRHELADPADDELRTMNLRLDVLEHRLDAWTPKLDEALLQVREAPPAEPAPIATTDPLPRPTHLAPPVVGGNAVFTGDTGMLHADCASTAKVLIDGAQVGTSPYVGPIPVGEHRVTFVVGPDKYTFRVHVKKGETVSLIKDLGPG
jgi:hypothetical protein